MASTFGQVWPVGEISINSYTANLSAGTTVAVTHGLNTKDIVVAVYRISDGVEVDVPFTRTSVNALTLNSVVDLAGHRIVVQASGGTVTGMSSTAADAAYVNVSGDTMTGALSVIAPTSALHATTKTYVDQYIPSQTALSGLWFAPWPYAVLSVATPAANQMRLSRGLIRATTSQLTLEISTLGAGQTFDVGIYTDTATGPGTLVTSATGIDGTTAGMKTANITVTPGFYWIAFMNPGSGTTAGVRTVSNTNPYHIGSDAPGTNNVPSSGWLYNSAGTSLPAGPLGAPTSRASGPAAIYFKAV